MKRLFKAVDEFVGCASIPQGICGKSDAKFTGDVHGE
jgi:hypothetical protein